MNDIAEPSGKYFRCLHCGAELGEVVILNGTTCIQLEAGYVLEMKIRCNCGAVRKFSSTWCKVEEDSKH